MVFLGLLSPKGYGFLLTLGRPIDSTPLNRTLLILRVGSLDSGRKNKASSMFVLSLLITHDVQEHLIEFR